MKRFYAFAFSISFVLFIGLLLAFLAGFFENEPPETGDVEGMALDSLFANTCSVHGTPGELLWELELGPNVAGTPAIDEKGDLYLGQWNSGSIFYAIHQDGSVAWQKDFMVSAESSVAIGSEGIIYMNAVFQGFRDQSTRVDEYPVMHLRGTFAFDSETGDILWVSTEESGSGADGSPAISQDGRTVYGATVYNKKHQDEFTQMGDTVPSSNTYALDAQTGELIWRIENTGWTFSSPTISPLDGALFIGSEDDSGTSEAWGGKGGIGQFKAVEADGTVRWTLSTDSEVDNSPTWHWDAAENLESVFARTLLGQVLRVNAQTGDILWEYDFEAVNFGTAVLSPDNQTLYLGFGFGEGEYSNQLVAISVDDGSVEWTYPFINAHTTPAVGDNGMIYFVTKNGSFIALNPDGTLAWEWTNNDPVVYGYVALNDCGVAYFASEDGTLYALQTESSGLARTSYWPSYRANPRATGLPNFIKE